MDSKRISKRELIKQVYVKIYGTVNEMSENDLFNLMNILEETVYENLKKATKDNSITVALFEGLNIESVYIPQKIKRNNLTGKDILTTNKIKPKATFTRTCCKKLSESVEWNGGFSVVF